MEKNKQMIRWKNKNPYLNLHRESCKVITSDDAVETKLNMIEQMIQRSYEGSWLFEHPSHKYQGNGVPQWGDDVSSNPYYMLLCKARSVLRDREVTSVEKLRSISEELAWMSNFAHLQDWAYTD